jgi:uncharacterized protein YjbJ (UPF0337 family)
MQARVAGSEESYRRAEGAMAPVLGRSVAVAMAAREGVSLKATLNPDGTVSGGLDDSNSFSATTLVPRINRSLGDLDRLRGDLQPGFGKVTQARRDAVENARQKAVGDLRDTLARRRVEGSSFGNASLAQAEAEFAAKRAEGDAMSYLQELEATSGLINQERQQLEAGASDAFKRAGLAVESIRGISDIFARDAQLRMQLAENDLASRRSLYGQDLSSRRNAGIADLTNRRNLAAQEEAAAQRYFGEAGDKIGSAFGSVVGQVAGPRVPSPN